MTWHAAAAAPGYALNFSANSSSGVLVTARPACTGASRACVVGDVETMRAATVLL